MFLGIRASGQHERSSVLSIVGTERKWNQKGNLEQSTKSQATSSSTPWQWAEPKLRHGEHTRAPNYQAQGRRNPSSLWASNPTWNTASQGWLVQITNSFRLSASLGAVTRKYLEKALLLRIHYSLGQERYSFGPLRIPHHSDWVKHKFKRQSQTGEILTRCQRKFTDSVQSLFKNKTKKNPKSWWWWGILRFLWEDKRLWSSK